MAELTGVASTAQDVASVGAGSPMPVPTVNTDHVIHVLRRAYGELSDEGHVTSLSKTTQDACHLGAEDLAQRDASDIRENPADTLLRITVEPPRDADAHGDDIVAQEPADKRLDDVRD